MPRVLWVLWVHWVHWVQLGVPHEELGEDNTPDTLKSGWLEIHAFS